MTKFNADLTLIFRSGAALSKSVGGEADAEETFVVDLIDLIRKSEGPIPAGLPGAGGFMASDVVAIDVRNVRVPETFPRRRRRPVGTKSGTAKKPAKKKA